MKLTFGKYKGLDTSQVPISYLFWLLENVELMTIELQKAVHDEWRTRLKDSQRTPARMGVSFPN